MATTERPAPPEPVPPQGLTPRRPVAGAPEAKPDEGSWVGLAVMLGLLAWLWIGAGWEYVAIVMAIVVMIFLHELGHYVAAKAGGMKVTEFFLGFGPKIWSFRRGETEYGLKAIPAGAYVKVIGMNNLEDVPPADEARTYRQASFPRRFAVAVAGSTMHFLLALGLLFTVLVGRGVDADLETWSFAQILDGSAAEAMGLQPGDRVVAIEGEAIVLFEELATYLQAHPGDEVTLTVQRGGAVVETTGTIGVNPDDSSRGQLGVMRDDYSYQRESVFAAIPRTFSEFGWAVKDTVVAIPQVFAPDSITDLFREATDDDGETTGAGQPAPPSEDDDGRVISLVGATQVGASLFDEGIYSVFLFLFILNIFVGVFNLIPLLPLDGGHVVIAVYERVREALRGGRQRYYADVTRMLPVAYGVVMVLLVVGLMAMYLDITEGVQL